MLGGQVNTRCVIGIGCDDHGDQIAGLLVARFVGRVAGDRFHVVESSGAPTELIAGWSGADNAVIVEAMPGDEPGLVQRCQPHPRVARGGCSSARLSPRLREALALGPLPAQVTVVTIAGQCFVRDAPVTPVVACAVESVAGDIILAGTPPPTVRRSPPAGSLALALTQGV
jgi:hydrogenase maturation protease